ncbi:MAG: diadenylate cyclase CdaA [Saprospiraceae bacterium]
MSFDIGFLPVSIWDVLDILIVGFLFYQIYRLLKGSIAFNIFVGVITLYVVWMIVDALKMDMLKMLLGQFVSVGVLILIIIFQPEVRRFLLFLGNTTLRRRFNFFERFFTKEYSEVEDNRRNNQIRQITGALSSLSKRRTGALIVFAKDTNLEGIISGGVSLDANISQSLLESIFNKESPLHDGAVIIGKEKIQRASCVLPVSENSDLPKGAGLRHRAGVGITEKAQVTCFIVSEETGKISLAKEGNLKTANDFAEVEKWMKREYGA